MVHIKARGQRISSSVQHLHVKSKLEIEVWGPYKPDGKPFQIISYHPASVIITKGAYSSPRNAQAYTIEAAGLTARTRIEVVNTDLVDDFKGLDITNIVTPFTSCDSFFVSVGPATGEPAFSEYFEEVIPAIAQGLAAFAAQKPPGLKNKAGFLLVQTYGEQSPGVTGRPSLHSNRMFNVQALVDKDQKGRMTLRPGQQENGVSIPWIPQGEGATDAERVSKSSPTFVYDSEERAVTHYFKILDARYGEALKVLQADDGTFTKFTKALQQQGYATDAKYAEKMQNLSNQALSQAKKWLDYQIKALDHDVATEENDGEKSRLAKDLDLLIKFKVELDNFKL